MTLLAKKAGVDITHVPYRGGGPAMNDVLGGHVDLIAGSAALVTAQLGPNPVPSCSWGVRGCRRCRTPRPAIEAGFPDFETLALVGHLCAQGHAFRYHRGLAKPVREILSEPAVAAQLRRRSR